MDPRKGPLGRLEPAPLEGGGRYASQDNLVRCRGCLRSAATIDEIRHAKTCPHRPGDVRKQCAKCPWKVGTNPHDIPNGYDVEKHQALARTIADGFHHDGPAFGCHEYDSDQKVPCIGWLHNQLGPGNNIGLRLAVSAGKIDGRYELDGPQHQTFQDTLPEGE